MDKGAGVMPVEAKEAFQEIIKFALMLGVFSILFIVLQVKIRNFLKRKLK